MRVRIAGPRLPGWTKPVEHEIVERIAERQARFIYVFLFACCILVGASVAAGLAFPAADTWHGPGAWVVATVGIGFGVWGAVRGWRLA